MRALSHAIIEVFILFCSVFCIGTAAFEGYEEGDGRVVVADFSRTELWSVTGAENSVHFNGKTPEGETAITYEISAPGKTKCKGPFLQGGSTWRGKTFHAVSLWVKGDGSGVWVQFRLMTGQKLFLVRFRLLHEDWKLMTFPIVDLTNEAGDRFDPAALSFIYFQTAKELRVSFGPVRLECGRPETIELLDIAGVRAVFAQSAPAIDGRMQEACWQSAPEYPLAHRVKSDQPLVEKTRFRILYDDKTLYLGAILDCADTAKLKADKREYGNDVWQDDCIEILLNPNNDMTTLCHFMVNSVGIRGTLRRMYDKVKDAFIMDMKWRPEWKAACALEPTKWHLEVAIPLTELGLGKVSGNRCGLQVGRENHTAGENSCFSPSPKFPHIPCFGLLSFARNADAARRIENVELRKHDPGRFIATGMVTVPAAGRDETVLSAHIINPERLVFVGESRLNDAGSPSRFAAHIDYQAESEGLHRLDLCVADKSDAVWQGFVFQHALPVETEYGRIVIHPEPKRLEWGEGFLVLPQGCSIVIPAGGTTRTRKTAEFLAEELYGYSGQRLAIEVTDRLPEAGGIVLTLGDPFPSKRVSGSWQGEAGELPAEGYALAVTGEGVTLKGADEPGLYYAVVTLMQVIRGPMRITEELRIRKTAIVDWPDVAWRYLSETPMWGRKRADNPGDIQWYKDYVKRVVAGSKLNMLALQLNGQYIFEHNTGLRGGGSFMSRKSYAALAELCREHFIELIPALQTGGHFWPPKSKYAYLFEEGFRRSANVTHPDFWKIMGPCMDELVEASGCRFFNILHDEWWSKPDKDITPELNGVPRHEIFLNHIRTQHDDLAARGIRCIMYGDMILMRHNGDPGKGPRKDLYTVADKLPKDIIMSNWSYPVDPESNRILNDLGFDVICAGNGFNPCPGDRNILKGYGFLSYGFGHLMAGKLSDSFTLRLGYTTVLRTADYAWNLKVDPGTSVREFERKKAENITAIRSVRPNPAAAVALGPVSIRDAANSNVIDVIGAGLGDLPVGKNEFGFIPMEIIDPEQKSSNTILALASNKTPLTVNMGRTASALYFLHAFHVTSEERKAFYKRWVPYLFGIPVAVYEVVYEDGSREEVDVRFGLNILDVCPPLARCRFMSEVRYSWQGRTSSGKPAFLSQVEWVNPRPGKTIASISLRSTGTEAVPIVVAISARGVKQPTQFRQGGTREDESKQKATKRGKG